MKKLKKGFTIIELVIVIAVIGVLTAVLVPTFSNLVKKANIASDTATVKILNEYLQVEEETTNSKPANMTEVVEFLDTKGFNLERYRLKDSTHTLLWNQETNRFIIKEGNNVVYAASNQDYKLWEIVDNVPAKANQKYNIYLREGFRGTEVETVVGFDAGKNDKIETIVVERTTGTNFGLVVRTNGGKLTVDAKNDTIKHYGEAETLNLTSSLDKAYHEYGKVGFATVTEGHFIAENKSEVISLVSTGNANAVKVDKQQEAQIEKAYFTNSGTNAGNVVLADLQGKTVETVKSEAVYQYNAAVMVNDVYYTNINVALQEVEERFGEGYLASGNMTIKLIKDIKDNGIKVASGSNLTIDFNGFTYDIDGTVGSVGTTTNGFQMLKDSTIVLKNGKITSSKAYILLQNYSNLTLENMIVDGTNMPGSDTYALSNNYGNIVIKNTTIYGKSNGFAFDLWYGMSASYDAGITVTVKADSKIVGRVEYGAHNRVTGNNWIDNVQLIIENGADISEATFVASSAARHHYTINSNTGVVTKN